VGSGYSDVLRHHIVAGTGFEPATSGLEVCRGITREFKGELIVLGEYREHRRTA
jgi:hypothetical protein